MDDDVVTASDRLDDRLITLVVARPGQPGALPSQHAGPLAAFVRRGLSRKAWTQLWLIYEDTLERAVARRRRN